MFSQVGTNFAPPSSGVAPSQYEPASQYQGTQSQVQADAYPPQSAFVDMPQSSQFTQEYVSQSRSPNKFLLLLLIGSIITAGYLYLEDIKKLLPESLQSTWSSLVELITNQGDKASLQSPSVQSLAAKKDDNLLHEKTGKQGELSSDESLVEAVGVAVEGPESLMKPWDALDLIETWRINGGADVNVLQQLFAHRKLWVRLSALELALLNNLFDKQSLAVEAQSIWNSENKGQILRFMKRVESHNLDNATFMLALLQGSETGEVPEIGEGAGAEEESEGAVDELPSNSSSPSSRVSGDSFNNTPISDGSMGQKPLTHPSDGSPSDQDAFQLM